MQQLPGNNYHNDPQTVILRKLWKKSREGKHTQEENEAFSQPSIDKLPNLDHRGLPDNPLNVSRMFTELPVSRYATGERREKKGIPETGGMGNTLRQKRGPVGFFPAKKKTRTSCYAARPRIYFSAKRN